MFLKYVLLNRSYIYHLAVSKIHESFRDLAFVCVCVCAIISHAVLLHGFLFHPISSKASTIWSKIYQDFARIFQFCQFGYTQVITPTAMPFDVFVKNVPSVLLPIPLDSFVETWDGFPVVPWDLEKVVKKTLEIRSAVGWKPLRSMYMDVYGIFLPTWKPQKSTQCREIYRTWDPLGLES